MIKFRHVAISGTKLGKVTVHPSKGMFCLGGGVCFLSKSEQHSQPNKEKHFTTDPGQEDSCKASSHGGPYHQVKKNTIFSILV